MKNLLLIVSICFLSFPLFSQDDTRSLTLTPVVFYENSSQEEVNPQIRKLLENKLFKIVTANGMASANMNDRHIIFPDLQIVTKDIVPSAPPKVSINLEVSFYIADFDQKRIYASESFAFKGVGRNDTKAMNNALRRLGPSTAINEFIAKGKKAIIQYYNENCDLIIKEAEVLVKTGREREALAALTRVPKECRDCYSQVAEVILPIYVANENKECEKYLAKAQSIWNSTQDYEGAVRTQLYFSRILPGMECYEEAKSVMYDMRSTLKVKDKREWEFRMSFAENRAEMLEWIFNKYYELELAKARNYQSWWR